MQTLLINLETQNYYLCQQSFRYKKSHSQFSCIAMTITTISTEAPTDFYNHSIFEAISKDIYSKGFSIQPNALPPSLSNTLYQHVTHMNDEKFDPAKIGRSQQHMRNHFVRRDQIAWINGETTAGKQWLEWTSHLKDHLNRALFLGLFSFESHFAHYPRGAFYKRHVDAFKGESNRILSVVSYLNPDWQIDDGGELLLYQNKEDKEGIKVIPALGTIAVFLSEEFPHEVLPAKRDRYSIAGWFRVNASTAMRADPPR